MVNRGQISVVPFIITTRKEAEMNNLAQKNVVFITLDSCRYDTAEAAHIPNIRSVGAMRRTFTHGSYTVPAHTAFFSGHLPVALDHPFLPYYSETREQLWRIQTGPAQDPKKCGVLLTGNDVLQGYRALSFYVLGVGGVTQFSQGSFLQNHFGNDFLYYGQNLDEEPLQPREASSFPLNNIKAIVNRIDQHQKWFLFINCPETHYPYDIGKGIPQRILDSFSLWCKSLNLGQEDNASCDDLGFLKTLHHMQIQALEYIDTGIGELLEALPKNREILVIICGDHGENFGEEFEGIKRWGHIFPSPKVMQVPLVIGSVKC